MYRLENEHLAVTIAPQGGELQSLIHREREYLWQGDARYWGRRAPVLFPIVGKLKDGRYHYHGHDYRLPQHGFARDQDFHLVEHGEHSLTYRLEDSGESGENYPFAFILDLSYTLRGKTPAPVLTVSYDDLPYLGLWTPADKAAPFLCIEPWAGVMDTATHDGNLESKPGIQRLAPHADWQRHYDIRIHDEA